MASRHRVVMTVSVPPDTARECREIAQAKGETVSEFFREMFSFYKEEKLKRDFRAVQRYGGGKAKKLKLTEAEIERLIFEGR